MKLKPCLCLKLVLVLLLLALGGDEGRAYVPTGEERIRLLLYPFLPILPQTLFQRKLELQTGPSRINYEGASNSLRVFFLRCSKVCPSFVGGELEVRCREKYVRAQMT